MYRGRLVATRGKGNRVVNLVFHSTIDGVDYGVMVGPDGVESTPKPMASITAHGYWVPVTGGDGGQSSLVKFAPGLRPMLKHGDPSRPGYAALHPNSGHSSVRSGVTATGAGERMADLPEPARAKVQAWCDSNNVDIDAIADDMFRSFDVPEAVRQGGRWYRAEFQHHAILMAERQGISVEESTAAIAITSARTRWAAEDGTLVNVRTAERFYEDQKAGKYDGMTAEQAARAVPNGYLMGNGFGQNVIAMMKGEISIDEAVTGAKRRSFFNNGMFPEHDTSATMDVWMGHYMARQSGMPILKVQNALSAKAPAYLKNAGHDMSPAYFVLREATLRAHDRAIAEGRVADDWLPLQSQATMWVAISQGYLGAVEGTDE